MDPEPLKKRRRPQKAKKVNADPQQNAPNVAEPPTNKPKRRRRPRNKAKKETANSQQNKPSFNIPNNGSNNPNDPRKDFNSLYDGDADIMVDGEKQKRHLDNWNEMDFDQQLINNIKECGFIRPRKIQEVVLPYLAEGFDIDCQSETGTGKTAAYLIPLIDNLIKEKRNHGLNSNGPYCLIIAPTREFVQQIFLEALKLTKNTGVTVAAAYGGIPVKKTFKHLSNGCNILVSSVGRLLGLMKHDLVHWENLDMSNLKYIVIDEADHFSEGNQKPDILRFFNHEFLPNDIKRQICFFSSTLQIKRLHRLSNQYVNLKKRVFISSVLESNQRIKYIFDLIPSEKEKFLCLTKRVSELTRDNQRVCPKIMIFVNTIDFADILTKDLTTARFPAVVIHSRFSQDEREDALYSFKKGDSESRILVSVKACGRGIDIPEMDYVINYNLPLEEFTFIQRCGRTGRTKNGTAISFYVESDDRQKAAWIRKVLQRADQKIPEFLKPNTLGIEESMAKLSINNRK